jgi:hypothetical protein
MYSVGLLSSRTCVHDGHNVILIGFLNLVLHCFVHKFCPFKPSNFKLYSCDDLHPIYREYPNRDMKQELTGYTVPARVLLKETCLETESLEPKVEDIHRECAPKSACHRVTPE